MNITEVRVYKVESDSLVAFATVTLDNEFVITGLKVIKGKNGLWVSMPSKKVEEEYKDIVFPITKEARKTLQDRVLSELGNEYTSPIEEDDLPF